MSSYSIHYRLTVYAERTSSLDPESTVLTPAGGAPHSDSFKVATMQGVSGFQPYLNLPRGRRQSIDPITKRLSVGSLTFRLQDQRTSTNNLQRWVTAFIGDNNGRTRLLGLKAYVEETTDGGTTWSPFYIGRITSFAMDNTLNYVMEVNEGNESLKVDLFDGFVSSSAITYANTRGLLPIGLPSGMGTITGSAGLNGTIVRGVTTMPAYSPYPYQLLTVTSASLGDPYNIITQELANRIIVSPSDPSSRPESYNQLSTRLYATSGSVNATFVPIGVGTLGVPNSPRHSNVAQSVTFREVGSTETGYYPLLSMNTGSQWQFRIVTVDEPSKEVPLFINNVSVPRFLKDILEGCFSRVGRFFVDANAITTLTNDNRYPTTRWSIDKKWAMNDFIEQAICQPFSIGYRTEAQLIGGVPQSVFVPFSMLLPSSSTGILTINSDDVVTSVTPKWSLSPPIHYVEGTWYRDSSIPITDYRVTFADAAVDPPDLPPSQMRSVKYSSGSFYAADVQLNSKSVYLDFNGLRYVDGETVNGVAGEVYVNQFANQFCRNYAQQFTRCPPIVELVCRRTSDTSTCQIGDWRMVQLDTLPDAGTHTRGVARLMQCIERSEDGLNLTLKFIDSAQNIVSTAPSFNTFATSSISPKYSITGSLNLYNSGALEVKYAVTPTTSGTQPHLTSSLWMPVTNTAVGSGTFPIGVNYLPAGNRVWLIARTQKSFGSDLSLPSVWASSSTGYVDTRTQPSASSFTFSNIAPTTVDLVWSGSVESVTFSEVLVSSSATTGFETVARVPPGSTRWTALGLSTANNPHIIGVRYGDPFGGYSTLRTVSLSLSGSAVQWPKPQPPTVLSTGLAL